MLFIPFKVIEFSNILSSSVFAVPSSPQKGLTERMFLDAQAIRLSTCMLFFLFPQYDMQKQSRTNQQESVIAVQF